MSSSSSTLIQKLSEKNIKLIDKIGEGTYGEIFIAEWNEQSQLVAVKIVTFESSNESIKNMFNREVYFSNKLKNHPNVLKLYDHFLIEDKSDDGEEFTIGVMIMEKMDVDLMDYILSKNSYISLTECRKIFSALVDVIGFLHSQSIAHCDIKPENVLLKLKEDRISKIKICDFGFTIQWQVDLRSSLSFGTNEYRSPELLRSLISNKTNQQSNNFNHQNSDNNNNNNDNRVINIMNCDLMPALNDYKEQINYEKADVWSLGVTMFACFTGLFPFVFQSETNQLVKLDNFSFLSRHFNNPKNPFYSQFLQNAKIYDYSSHYSQSQQRRKPVNLMKYVNNVVYRGHEDDDDYAYYESEFGDLVDLFEGIFEPSPSLRFAITDVHTHRWFILHENNGMDPCNSSFYVRRCSVPRSMSIDDIENSAHNNNNNNNNNITSSSNYPRKRRNSFSRIKGFINSHFK